MVSSRDRRWLTNIAVVWIILRWLTCAAASRCMFDAVKPAVLVRANISYSVTRGICENTAGMCKRDAFNRLTVEDHFQPIRIHAHFSSYTAMNIDAVQRARLTRVIDRLVSTASSIFSGKFLNILFTYIHIYTRQT